MPGHPSKNSQKPNLGPGRFDRLPGAVRPPPLENWQQHESIQSRVKSLQRSNPGLSRSRSTSCRQKHPEPSNLIRGWFDRPGLGKPNRPKPKQTNSKLAQTLTKAFSDQGKLAPRRSPQKAKLHPRGGQTSCLGRLDRPAQKQHPTRRTPTSLPPRSRFTPPHRPQATRRTSNSK